MESYLIKGLLIGLIFGVPAGAIGALAIQRTLAHGFWAGLFTGLGSSAADLLYACVGVFGITVVSDFLLTHQLPISLAGGLLIMTLGVLIFRKKAEQIQDNRLRCNLPAFFGASFAVTIANPAAILSFFVAFSTFDIGADPTLLQSGQLVLGILLGTCCWWGLLSSGTAIFRSKITDSIYQRLNWIMGGLLFLFGAAVILHAFTSSVLQQGF